MNENSRKRREWVKTAAIVFLSVLLVLTFFSNTIMNYSLPEVAAKYVESGTITAKIREQGIVESSDPYNVTVKQTRKVTSVAVKAGDKVEKGDVLVYLADEESTELKAAQDKLKAAQEAYDAALLADAVNAGVIKDSQSNISISNYRQQITNAQAARDNAQKEVDAWTEDYNGVTATPPINPAKRMNLEDQVDRYNETAEDKRHADNELTAVSNRLKELNAKLELAENSVSSGNASASPQDIENLNRQIMEATQEQIDAQTKADQLALALASAKTHLDEKIADVKLNKDNAEANLKEKTEDLAKLIGDIGQSRNLELLREAIAEAQEDVDKELEKSVDAIIKADIAGTIMTMNAVAGKEVSAAEAVAVIQPEGKGYTMSISIANDKAKRLSVGDKADLVNSWRYDDVEVVIASIKPDPKEPAQKKLVTFNVTGDVTAGQSLNISVGQKSANYDTIVPNSAIREDNNGKFVLQVVQKSSPLGNRYVATRVDVEVLASDDTRSAVSGALAGYEFVITTSTKPVEAGQLVRLPDDTN